MPRASSASPSSRIGRYFFFSLLVHLVAAEVAYFAPKLFDWKKKPDKVIWVELAPGVGYDVEAIKEAKNLPESTIEEQKKLLEAPPPPAEETAEKIETPPPPKEEEKTPPPDETAMLEIEEAKKKEEEKKKKAEEEKKLAEAKAKAEKDKAKAKEKQVVPTQSALDKKIAEALKRTKEEIKDVPIESAQVENPGEGVGAQGTSANGPTDPAYAEYYALIKMRINKQWVLLPKLFDPNQPLSAQIEVTMDKSGEVTNIEMVKSSGNQSFDLSAKRAIEAASPLPQPPAELEALVLDGGFLIEFLPGQVKH